MPVEKASQRRFYLVNHVLEFVENKPLHKGQKLVVREELNPSAIYEETRVRPCYGLKNSAGNELTPIALLRAIKAGQIKAPGNISDFVIELVTGLNKRLRPHIPRKPTFERQRPFSC